MDRYFFDAFIETLADAVAERLSSRGASLKPPVKAKPSEAEAVLEAQSAQATSSEYLTTREAAALLGLNPKTLERMRGQGRGPKFVKVGGSVRYRRADLDLE